MPPASRDGAKGSERRPRRHGDDAGGKKPADSVKNAEPWMYKSKLCSRWVATGDCSFADECWNTLQASEGRRHILFAARMERTGVGD